MDSNMILALEITVVGMGLVFAAIILLWGVMAVLVRLAKDPPEEEEVEAAEPADLLRLQTTQTPALSSAQEASGNTPVVAGDPKRLAAAVAVAYALAQQTDTNQPHEFPLPPTAIVSAWQAIMRTRMLNKRGSIR